MKQKGNIILIVLILAAAICGYLVYSGKINLNQAKLIPVQQTTQPKPSSFNETSNWKTYTSKNCNFSLKYPNNWETYSYGHTPKEEPLDYCSLSLAEERFFRPIGGNAPGMSLQVTPTKNTSYSTAEKSIKGFFEDNRVITTIEVDGISGTKVTGQFKGVKQAIALFHNKDYVFEIQSGLLEEEQFFDQILSTFKFTQ